MTLSRRTEIGPVTYGHMVHLVESAKEAEAARTDGEAT
jgi:ribosomal protein S28E/S33